MHVEQVIETLEALAKSDAHPPDVVTALDRAATMLRKRIGTRWSAEEEEQLCREFDAGMKLQDIARGHRRTRGSINARLVKLGRLDPEAVRLRYAS